MSLFSPKPGRHERHLKRKYNNPLFQDHSVIDDGMIKDARLKDEKEQHDFSEKFTALVKKAVSLPPQSETDDILELRTSLESAYIENMGLADDREEFKAGILKLLNLINSALSKGFAEDPVASKRLEDEIAARNFLYELLVYPLVADIVYPESPVSEGDLVASLLSEDSDALQAAIKLFNVNHLGYIKHTAAQLVENIDDISQLVKANINLIEAAYEEELAQQDTQKTS